MPAIPGGAASIAVCISLRVGGRFGSRRSRMIVRSKACTGLSVRQPIEQQKLSSRDRAVRSRWMEALEMAFPFPFPCAFIDPLRLRSLIQSAISRVVMEATSREPKCSSKRRMLDR
ncbi:hypothetical protein [Komagataeibacter sp. SM21]|uniref:hypothetical protein n=1 Tax=Komagataeibacter sp. SM21 TaxID=3242899 RepID=UPI003528E6C9